MNSNLANQLLSNIMNWDASKLESERSSLEFIGSIKYDSYDRYMPGTRFMSSLVQWLNQFNPQHRSIVYDFVMKDLVFISSTQMNYLVDLLYDSKIKPILYNMATDDAKMPKYMHCNSAVQKYFQIEKRSALIIGLSDGAHTDILRRSAEFSNEQVLTNYYPDKNKLDEMLEELAKDSRLQNVENPMFRSIFLIDDFTASGKSFLRFDKKDKSYHGKLKKIITQLCTQGEDKLSRLFSSDQSKLDIHILFCIATMKAEENIKQALQGFLDDKGWSEKVNCHIHLVQRIDESVSNRVRNNEALLQVICQNEYFDKEAIITKSYEVGKCDSAPYLGFDECALPIVLSHNTPNNSLPILWQYTKSFRGLFPRINRH